MKILICCEDEDYVEVMRNMMKKYHSSNGQEFEIGLTMEEAIDKANHNQFDLAFIDCLLEGENAMEIGRDVKKLNPSCLLLYMHTELEPTYINESFIIGTFQFLIKGEDEMMEKEFLRASHIYAKESFTLPYTTDEMENIQLSPYDILYIETKNSPTRVATKKNIYKGWFKDEMCLVEQYLKEYNFLKIHSHYIVNMEHVLRIRPNEILMINGDSLPIAVLNQDKIKGAFRQFMNW